MDSKLTDRCTDEASLNRVGNILEAVTGKIKRKDKKKGSNLWLTIKIFGDTNLLMARPLRIQYPGAVYHAMNRGGSRQRVFLDKQDYEAFLKTIGEVRD